MGPKPITRSNKGTKDLNKQSVVTAPGADSHTMSFPDASSATILAAIENQGRELRELIEHSVSSITTRLGSLENSLKLVKKENTATAKKVASIATTVSAQDARLDALEKTCQDLQAENELLSGKVLDLIGRSRRSNLRFVGLSEALGKGNPTSFITEVIASLFGQEAFPRPVEVDRAHRIGPAPAASAAGAGQRPRPRVFIAKIHRYQDRERILRLCREKGELLYNGTRLHIFPDYSPEVLKQRQAFSSVIKMFREANVKTSLRFPAKLHVDVKGKTTIFIDPETAKTFAETLSSDPESEPEPEAEAETAAETVTEHAVPVV